MTDTLGYLTIIADKLVCGLRELDMTMSLAESCTGGLISAAITEIPGASYILDRAFVTYSNAAKIGLLGVGADLLATHGAVSAETAEAMAIGARIQADTDFALSVTGIAGPTGGSATKPVGLVYIGVCDRQNAICKRYLFSGDRRQIRLEAADAALNLLAGYIHHGTSLDAHLP